MPETKDAKLRTYLHGSWADSGVIHFLNTNRRGVYDRTNVHGFEVTRSMSLDSKGLSEFREILVHPSVFGDPMRSAMCFNPGLSLAISIDHVDHQILCCMHCLWIRIHANGEAAGSSIAMSAKSASALLVLHAKWNGMPMPKNPGPKR